MTRLDATRLLITALGDEVDAPVTPIVASLGHPAYDLFAAGDRPANFYTWGGMGLASSIGLGLAIARPDLRVFVLDGDGSLLMNLGSLATIGWTAPDNLVLIVWDNEEYGTTGGQTSATAHGADLAAAARALGIRSTVTVRNERELQSAITEPRRDEGPRVIVAKVEESAPVAKPPLDYIVIKDRFMTAIGSHHETTAARGGRST
jgi:thiamine pyrophosphate-dependent acetolactate synthase large subunit-like protein